jgi:hypothetical protein
MRLTLSALAFCLFLLSCGGTTNQFILEDYSIDQRDVSISVLLVEPDYHFENFPDHVYGALRPQEQQIFNQDLAFILNEKTGARVTGITSPPTQVNNSFELREFNLDGSAFTALAPKEGQTFTVLPTQTRFVLILDQYFFTTYTIEVGGDSYAGHESETEDRLRFESNYIIWDTELNDAVAWGKINTTEQIEYNSSRNSYLNMRNTYLDLMDKAMERIVAVSPFNGVDV